MPSIFNTLNIGYTGLSAAQVGINTTGHNISNAESDGYTRQRVVTAAGTPVSMHSGNIGNGVEVQAIKRVFDNFVFDRYTDTYSNKEYTDLEKSALETLSTYFPEIDAVGVKADLQEYYNMWQTFADNPDNDSIKMALAKQTQVLSEHISYTQEKVSALHSQLNEQLLANVNEVNSLAQELSGLNKSIDVAEAGGLFEANDLRDKRNVIERDLSRLIGATFSRDILESNIQIDSSSNTKSGTYTVMVDGFNIVDGNTYHPIHITSENNPNGFYELSYERQDGVLIPMEDSINDGKIGAILELRGGAVDESTGSPTDGIIQRTISELDTFAQGIIESTNNLYANNAVSRMESSPLDVSPANSITSSGLNIKEGSFSIVVYDIDGNVAATRDIEIDIATKMEGVAGSNSIQAKIATQKDDNSDGNATNDIDDFINFNYGADKNGDYRLVFSLDPLQESQGYTFSIEDNLQNEDFSSGTNFAGALGMNRFFDGNDASTIDLNFKLKDNATLMSAAYTSVAGDNRLALDMVQHQFEKFDYAVGDEVYHTTAYGMFDIIATEVGTATNSAIMRNETATTQFNAVEMEYFATSKVSIDEEMTNLIKFQTSYGAAAKVITTIDQMMNTLLGIKQ